MQKLNKAHLNNPAAKQKGIALILMAFIIGLAAVAYILHALDPARLRAEQDKKTMQTLNLAKEALIAWSVGHVFSPGQMPWPDRHLDPLIYDGSSDCVTTLFQYSYLLGQLPSQPDTSPCLDPNTGLNMYPALSTYPGLGQGFRDAQGNRLWYAVSRNLVRDHQTSTNPVINPNIINVPIYPWLEVLDRKGSLVSNRVAAVIIAPGVTLEGQNRSGAADASQFLDRFQIGAAVFNNRGYATPDEDFIMGEDSRNVSSSDPTFVQPYNFNDKLVYITIDELIAALEKRVGEEVRANLATYTNLNGNYPFAANLGGVGAATTRAYRCSTNNLIGSLPVDNPGDTCTYSATTTSVNSKCSFQNITSVAFRKGSSGNFTSASPACTYAGTTCTCTGAGSCSVSGTVVFSCDALGNCNSPSSTGRIRFLGAGLESTSNSPVCSLGVPSACVLPANTISRTVTCNGASSTVTMGYICNESITTLPAWFKTNRWQDYVFYEMTRPTNLAGITVGNKSTSAAIVTTGAAIAPQVRPSCLPADYLDGAQNISVNSVYEATSKLRANNYNDQTFVVSP
jgi:hypothetical protein